MSEKQNLLDQIGEYLLIGNTIAEKCKSFVANESIPVSERWEIFRVAPGKGHRHSDEYPHKLVDSPYDDLDLQRHQTFDVVDELDGWQEALNDGEEWGFLFDKGYGQKELDEFKNYYMTRYLGSWKHDW